MDFIDGFSVVMLVVDWLSKYAHFAPLKHPYTALSVAKTFVQNAVRLHGIPMTHSLSIPWHPTEFKF